MKLLLCPTCQDVRKLRTEGATCACGRSWGRYVDDLNAEIGGEAIPLGFSNASLREAIQRRPKIGRGMKFAAFVIAEECETIEVRK